MRNTSPLNRDIIMETIDQHYPLVTRSVSCVNQINYSFMTNQNSRKCKCHISLNEQMPGCLFKIYVKRRDAYWKEGA